MKYLILVGDGMGDYPLKELDDKTPLEAAETPAMDYFCKNGDFFLTKTVPDGYPPGSDVANLSLMGYDPRKYYTGRAPLEAASMGITLAPDETAFRCNLVTLSSSSETYVRMVDFTAGHISSNEASALINSLNEECDRTRFSFHAGVSYRHLLICRGELPGFKTVPPHDYIDQNVHQFYSSYFDDAGWLSLMKMAEEELSQHPVNTSRVSQGLSPATAIWPWGEGKMPQMPSIAKKYGITGTMISAVDLLKGIGVYAGLDVVNVPGATGFIDTNYEGKSQAALDALANQDFVFVHLEAPDESGHQGSIENKIKAIEDFDRKIVSTITTELRKNNEDYRVVVTMDHFTPISLRTHTIDTVPTILYDSREKDSGSGLAFCERTANENEDIELINEGYELIGRLFSH